MWRALAREIDLRGGSAAREEDKVLISGRFAWECMDFEGYADFPPPFQHE